MGTTGGIDCTISRTKYKKDRSVCIISTTKDTKSRIEGKISWVNCEGVDKIKMKFKLQRVE